MTDPGPQKGPASTARIVAQTKAVEEAIKGGALTVGVDWGKGEPVSRGPSPLMKAVDIARDMKRLQEASHASYLCMTKATFESLKNHPDMLSDEAQKLYQGFPVQVFESEFECVLFMRMKHAADGSKGMLVKGPEIAI